MEIIKKIINKLLGNLEISTEEKAEAYSKFKKYIKYRTVDLVLKEKVVSDSNKDVRENIYYTLNKIMSTIAGNLDFKETAQNIVDVMVNSMGYRGGVLFLLNKEKRYLQAYTYSTTEYTKKVVKNLPFEKFSDIKLSLDTKDDLLIDAINKKNIYVAEGMAPYDIHLIPWALAKWIDKVTQTKYSIVIPVISENEVVGIISINSKQDFKDQEIEMLRSFANQVSIAIRNSRQYEQIKLQFNQLQEKTYDLESLLSLSNMDSSGMKIEKSVQGIMDILPVKLGHLGVLGAILARYDEKAGKVYAYVTTESSLTQKAKKILPKSLLEDYSALVAKINPLKYSLTTRSIFNDEITKSDDFVDFISPPVDARAAGLIKKVLNAKATVAVPINIRGAKLGTVIYVFNKPLADVDGRELDIVTAFTQHLGVVLENLQFYKSLNKNIEELTIAKDKLKNALDMKNDFLHIVSHQLRTPLTVMRGFISMWNARDFDKATREKKLEIKERIVSNTERLNNIVNDMVTAVESEGELKLNFQPIDISKMLQENIEMLKHNFEKKNLYLKYKKISKNIPKVEADGKLLHNVFMNLVDNAEKYTAKGGLTVEVKKEKNNINISFIDTGIGLSQEDKKILFQKFSRGKKSNYINPDGSGLGLFIAKQIIAKHNGKIKANSEGEGMGSIFTVILPIRQGR